ncbi:MULTISPECIES: hypothetical protein [Pseudomonas syringae group]|uniref:Uncharacterized protein n=2 Tax=Pseudomonas syringae group TaxID=136849 RepID=A0ABV4PA46_9PSED|nr:MULTISPECIES: hypothetical protein [Pseudomonas syringae group]KWS41932.1 hypothetical protein AL059_19525 [Pseudomonas syringae pv. papulans]MDH4602822.1 hypothetical protein [Pseudomonas syringae pv. papulans]MDH4621435.1 hypothetical protein [Pseudomonas syringae pv. papulans]RMS11642.1 hypothetical protein ALP71_01058 [Pseudomonas coronafaciens pv. garcae]
MSQPKSNTAPKKAQVAVTQPFEVIDHGKDEFLQVRSGIPALDAMELSSAWLSEVLLFIRDYYDEETGLKTSGVYLIQQQLISAKALIDASVVGIMEAERSGGAQ